MVKKKYGWVKGVLLILLMGGFFLYGFAFNAYKVFPNKQLLQAKHYLEHSFGFFENETVVEAEEIETLETAIQRLLIKKINLDRDIVHGGGMHSVENILYIITNKGTVLMYDLDTYSEVEAGFDTVPLNYDQLIASGHPYRTEFRFVWFRVNGVFAERNAQGTHTLYASHETYNSREECFNFTISRMEIDYSSNQLNHAGNWETLFSAEPCIPMVPDEYLTEFPPFVGNVSGGKMENYDPNTLIVSVGDYDRHGLKKGIEAFAQDPSVPYGKFILVDKDTGAWERYTMGNRNPLGLYIDREGTIWSTENGPEGGDELNIIERGKNYGWPVVSYGLWYFDHYHFSDDYIRGSHEDYDKPVFGWTPSIATSNLIKIEGQKFEHWRGDLIVSSLKDRSLHRLKLDDDNRVVYNEPIYLGHRIRDIITLLNESIALITDDSFLIILEDGGGVYEEMGPEVMNRITELNKFNGIAGSGMDGRIITAQTIYEQNCATCHSLNNENRLGPHLNDLFNRTIGEADGFRYSSTLISDKREWTPELFREFLQNPENEFRGNNMSKIELTEAEIDSLLQYIR